MDDAPFNRELLELLARAEGPTAQRALIQALQATKGPLQAAVLAQLLGRDQQEVWARVAGLLPALHDPARQLLRDDVALLEPLARVGLSSEDPSVRLNVVGLLAKGMYASCAYLLSGGVNDSVALVRNRAAEALLALVRKYLHDGQAMAEYLAPAVAATMRNYRVHECREVMQSAVALGFRCPEEILVQLDRPANRLTGTLMGVLRTMDPAEAAEFVLSSLRFGLVGQTAKSYICQADWTALAQLGAHEHWLALRPIAEALAGIRHLRIVAEDPAGIGELSAEVQGGALRLVMACGISAKLRQTLLGVALSGEASLARAALPLVFTVGKDPVELLLMALHGPHKDVRSVAAARIIAGGVDVNLTEHLLESLSRLDEPVRTMVGQFLAADNFQRYWRSYKRLDGPVRVAAGKALLKLDRRVVDLLAGRLVGRDVNDQLQAVQMSRQMKISGRFANSLCRLACRAPAMVRSAAAAALGEVEGFDSCSTLARCLGDADPRVQANAVEALANLGADPSAALDKINSPHNRVRANVVLWLLKRQHPQGPMALAAMLTDSLPAHRISALWVVRTLAYAPATALLRRLATGDSETRIRARAASTLQVVADADREAVAV